MPECPDNAVCAEIFVVGTVAYQTSCVAIKPQHVSDTVLAEGSHTVHVIDEVDPKDAVAWLGIGEACEEGGRDPNEEAWHFGFAQSGQVADTLVCEIGDFSAERLRARDC